MNKANVLAHVSPMLIGTKEDAELILQTIYARFSDNKEEVLDIVMVGNPGNNAMFDCTRLEFEELANEKYSSQKLKDINLKMIKFYADNEDVKPAVVWQFN